MKKENKILITSAAVLAGALLLIKPKSVSGIGGEYEDMANAFAARNGVRLQILGSEYKRHFSDDVRPRSVFKCRLTRNGKSYTFDFGQSYADGAKLPTMYDILASLTKYDVGDFENFCAEFGYEPYTEDYNTGRYGVNKQAMKTYHAVLREYNAVERLFGDIMDELQEIY